MLAGQFYLDWHANYSDWQVLCGKDDIEEIIQSFSDEDGFGFPMTASQKRLNSCRNIRATHHNHSPTDRAEIRQVVTTMFKPSLESKKISDVYNILI